MMPDSAFDELTEEEKQAFLAQYAPATPSLGPVTRAGGGAAPAPMRPPSPLMSAMESSGTGGVEPDLMRRFVEAQQRGAGNASFSRLGNRLRNAGRLYAGLDEVPDDSASLRGRPVADLMQQEGVKAQQRTQARQAEVDAVNLDKTRAETTRAQANARATEADEKREAALADPTSQESSALRATASELLKGRVSAGTLASMSGTQIRDALKFGTSQINAEAMAGLRQSQIDATNTQNAFEQQLARWRIGLERDRLDQDWAKFEKSEAQERELAAMRAEKEKEKATKGTVIPGYEIAPDAAPTPDDAKKVKASLASATRLKGDAAELRRLYRQHGTKLTGPVATRMGQLATSIALEAKTVAELGALTGPDLDLVNKLSASDPASLMSNVKDLFGMDETETGLDGLVRWADQTVESNLQTFGYVRSPTSASGTSAPPSAAPHGMKSSLTPSTTRPPQAAPGASATSPSNDALEVSVKGMKSGELKPFLVKNGVRDGLIRLKETGRIVLWKGGKLLPVEGK